MLGSSILSINYNDIKLFVKNNLSASSTTLTFVSMLHWFINIIYRSISFEKALQMPGVVSHITAADVPGSNDFGPAVIDDKVFATTEVIYVARWWINGDKITINFGLYELITIFFL